MNKNSENLAICPHGVCLSQSCITCGRMGAAEYAFHRDERFGYTKEILSLEEMIAITHEAAKDLS